MPGLRSEPASKMLEGSLGSNCIETISRLYEDAGRHTHEGEEE